MTTNHTARGEPPGSQPQMDVPMTIPNADRTRGVATLMVSVPVRHDPDTGEALMTDEAFRLIEQARCSYKTESQNNPILPQTGR